MSLISTSIGARFDDAHANPTEQVTVNFDRSALFNMEQTAIDNLIARGLYSVLSDLKTSMGKDITREQFKTAMAAINIKQVAAHCLVSRSRGRSASDYPQATRLNEIKFLREQAIKALMKGESFPMVDYEGLDIIARNKTVNDGGFGEKAELAYIQLIGAADSLENGAEKAICERLSAWIASVYSNIVPDPVSE